MMYLLILTPIFSLVESQVALLDSSTPEKARGIAGTVLVHKAAGECAERCNSLHLSFLLILEVGTLEEVYEVALAVSKSVKTIGFSPVCPFFDFHAFRCRSFSMHCPQWLSFVYFG